MVTMHRNKPVDPETKEKKVIKKLDKKSDMMEKKRMGSPGKKGKGK